MEIISATYIKSSPGYKDCPEPDRPEFAFIGRSNVGKSSLINMLCNRKGLAKTSATPGKTQLINHFEILFTLKGGGRGLSGRTGEAWYLVDLPGYGYASVSKKARHNWSNVIESYIRKRENLVTLFVLVDSRHEPQSLDLEFVNKLGEWEIPFALVFTKADKNKPGATHRKVTAFLNKLKEHWQQLPRHFITSAIDRTGRTEILDYIAEINRMLKAD